jgi:hypothetical protein
MIVGRTFIGLYCNNELVAFCNFLTLLNYRYQNEATRTKVPGDLKSHCQSKKFNLVAQATSSEDGEMGLIGAEY